MKRAASVLVGLLLVSTALTVGPSVEAVGGSISGTVTDTDGGAAIPHVLVKAIDSDTGSTVDQSWTGSGGTYLIPNLPDGDYRVDFETLETGYVREYYDDVPDWASATILNIAAGSAVVNVDASLVAGGAVSGTVIDDTTLLPLEGILVRARDASISTYRSYGSAWTDAAGEYAIVGLPAGDHLIEFDDRSTTGYITEWWNDQPNYLSADSVAVVASTTTPAVDAALTLGTTISGHVGDLISGADIEGIAVYVQQTEFQRAGSATTDEFGDFTVTGLDTGTYRVEFHDWTSRGYVTQWWNAKADYATADPVSVVLGTPTTGINAHLRGGGAITGTVTNDTTDDPIEGIWVSAHIGPTDAYGVYTDASGEYAINGLPAGTYDVYFVDHPDYVYVHEFWNDRLDRDSADPVVVPAGGTVSDIDAALSIASSVSGTVTDRITGNPLSGINVDAYEAASDIYVGSAATNPDGTYTVPALAAGDYHVSFDAIPVPDYMSEWWNGRPDIASADVVAVTAATPTTGVDIGLWPKVGRLAGPDRFETAKVIAEVSGGPSISKVYVANGFDYPDALAGGPAAAVAGAHLLLVTADSIPQATADALTALSPDEIIILGGVGVVSDAVAAELLNSYAPSVRRLWGTDRYSTAVDISKDSYPAGACVVYLASGLDYPDALAGVVAAARDNGPLLLSGPNSLPQVTADEIVRLNAVRVVLLGGNGALSSSVWDAVTALSGVTQVERLWGADRYATAVAVAQAAFPTGSDVVYLSSGLNFPDGLAGGPSAYRYGAPLLLTPPNALPQATADAITQLGASRVILLGGTGAVSDTVRAQVEAILP